jgi:ferrous iron transport protein B
MQAHFDGQVGAFAYLLFILLYAPCVAATAAIYKETSGGWALFVAGWTTFLAYLTATVFYQTMTYSQHPDSSLAWNGGLIGAFALILLALRFYGSRQNLGAGR